LPPPAHTPDGKGPSAFPTLLTDLSKHKASDGIKPLARGFSKGKQEAIPGAFHECENCGQTHTPLWRRSEKNELLCNACGLYVRTHHTHRPIAQAEASRNRQAKESSSTGDYTHRKRKTVFHCSGCKLKPSEERPESCSDCDDLRRRKAEKASRAAANKEKARIDAGEERSRLSQEPCSSGSVYPPDASPSKIVSVGGRRGKQPPGAGRQLPRGIPGQTTSPPLQTDVPVFESVDAPVSTSPKKIKLKMRLSSDPRKVVVNDQTEGEATEFKLGIATTIRMKFKKDSLTRSSFLPTILPKPNLSIDEQATPKRRRTSSTADAVIKSEDGDDAAQSSPERRRKRVESMLAESGDRTKRSQRRLQTISAVGTELC